MRIAYNFRFLCPYDYEIIIERAWDVSNQFPAVWESIEGVFRSPNVPDSPDLIAKTIPNRLESQK